MYEKTGPSAGAWALSDQASIYVLTLCAFAVTTAEFVIAGILPQVAMDLSVSIPAAGQLVTAYAFGMIIGGPLLTVLTAGMPRKLLMASLLAVFIAGNLLAAVAPGYGFLLASRLASGFVVATFFALAIVVAASLAQTGRAGAAIARVALGFNLAMILGAPLGTVVGQQFGWRWTFVVIAVLAAIALFMFIRLVPVRNERSAASLVGELRVIRDSEFQLSLALTAIGNAGVLMVFVYLAPLLTDIAGFSSDAVPLLLLTYGVGATLGNLIGGRLADRALIPSLIGLLAVLATALVLFGFAGESQSASWLMVFVVGALAFAIIPGMQMCVLHAAQKAPTLGIALNASGFQIAAAIAAWSGGVIAGSPNGLASIPFFGAAVTVFGTGIAMVLYASRRRRDTDAGDAEVDGQ